MPGPQTRETPTSCALDPGQLDPAAPHEPVAETPEPTVDERELERRWLLARDGGSEGSASRVAHLNNRPDHARGL
jgi:hypothetical protein